jgi:hypothetical protein
MGDVILSPLELTTGEPFSQRWGIAGRYGFGFAPALSINQRGSKHTAGVDFSIAESHEESLTISGDAAFGTSVISLFPSPDSAGKAAPQSHWSAMFGMGRHTRPYSSFSDEGDFSLGLSTAVTQLIGRGGTTIGGQSVGTWDAGTRYALLGDWRPAGGRGPELRIGPGFYNGVEFGGTGSPANRMRLELTLNAEVAFADGSERSNAGADTELGAAGVSHGLFTWAHHLARGYLFDQGFTKPMAALTNYGIAASSGDRGRFYDLPLLDAAAKFSGGLGNPLSPWLRSGSGWLYAAAGLYAISGAVTIGTASPDGKAGGVADIAGSSARLAGLAIAGIDEPSKRLSLSSEEVRKREAIVDLSIFALGAVTMIVGGLTKQPAAMGGGSSTALGVALGPDAASRDFVESTDVGYAYSFYYGARNGNRGGILMHKAVREFPWQDVQLFFRGSLRSPVLIGSPSNYPLASDAGAATGLQWKPAEWVRLLAGIEAVAVSGDPNAKAGIGGTAGIDLTLPISKGFGLTAGLAAGCHKLFPSGHQCEVGPWGGVRGKF